MNYQNNNYVPVSPNIPLSKYYKDTEKLFLKDGEAYKMANAIQSIAPHQLRKILNQVKLATNEAKKGNFQSAKNKVYIIVPLAAYDAGRNKNNRSMQNLYVFISNHINETTIKSNEDIIIFDQLFTSIVAYHKYFSKQGG